MGSRWGWIMTFDIGKLEISRDWSETSTRFDQISKFNSLKKKLVLMMAFSMCAEFCIGKNWKLKSNLNFVCSVRTVFHRHRDDRTLADSTEKGIIQIFTVVHSFFITFLSLCNNPYFELDAQIEKTDLFLLRHPQTNHKTIILYSISLAGSQINKPSSVAKLQQKAHTHTKYIHELSTI